MSLFHTLLSRQLNRLLVCDREYMQKLQPLAGASLRFDLTDLRFSCVVVFHHTYLEVLSDYPEPQLTLWGKSTDFVRFLLAKESRSALLQSRKIDFSGDLMLLEKLEALLPVFKHLNLNFLKKIIHNRVAYYQEEKPCLLSPILLQDFEDRLQRVQERLDRCEARLVYLSDTASLQ